VGPTVREEDGLALSSRNAYLSPEEREAAPGLYRALLAVQAAFSEGERSAGALSGVLTREIGRTPALRLQYAEIVQSHTLERVDPVTPGAAAVAAAFCGATRLLDNHILAA